MITPSKTSLSGLVMAVALSSSGCDSEWTGDEDQCTTPFIYDITASPEEAYTSDSLVVTAYLENTCASVPILTFPDYDSSVFSSFPGYEVEPSGLEGVEGIVLERTTHEGLVYATGALPLASFPPGDLLYSVTTYGGLAAFDPDTKDTLSRYVTLLSADTGE